MDCPKTTRALVEIRQVQKFAKDLLALSKANGGIEYGGHIIRTKDGKLQLVNVTAGVNGHVQLPDAPKNAVAEIHTHPDETTPGGTTTFDFPSGPDTQRANFFHVYGVVVTPRALLVVPVDEYTYDTFLYKKP